MRSTPGNVVNPTMGDMDWLRERFSLNDHRAYLVPLARVLRRKKEAAPADLYEPVADLVGTTPAERLLLPDSGGTQPVYRNRIQFARQSLIDAGVIAPRSVSGRGVWSITPEGIKLLDSIRDDHKLLDELLSRSASGARARADARQASRAVAGIVDEVAPVAPDDTDDGSIDAASVAEIGRLVEQANDATYSRLLAIVQQMDPTKFEHLAGDVLRAALRATSVRITPPSGDDGIDGVLAFDDLGIRRVVFQAKRYAAGSSVDRPAVDQFWAAVQRQRADYGIFVTTSTFTKGAANAAADFGMKLVDGDAFVDLMSRHSIGVRTVTTYSLYEVDVTWSADTEEA